MVNLQQTARGSDSKMFVALAFFSVFLVILVHLSRAMYNGDVAGKYDFPHAVLIHYVDASIMTCTGAIIGEWWIVTAGHCCDYCRLPGKVCVLEVGNTKRSKGHPIYIASMHTPGKWIPQGTDNEPRYDICAVKTRTRIDFNERVQPICIPPDKKIICEKPCFAYGWGRPDCKHDSPGTPRLMKGNAYFDYEHCELLPDMICARDSETDSVPVTYPTKGDSGHVLTCKCMSDEGMMKFYAFAVFVLAACPIRTVFELPHYSSTRFNYDFLHDITRIDYCPSLNANESLY